MFLFEKYGSYSKIYEWSIVFHTIIKNNNVGSSLGGQEQSCITQK